MAKGAGFGAASHGAGTARAYEIGQQEGVVSSLVMMLSGVVTVIIAPAIGHLCGQRSDRHILLLLFCNVN